MRGGTGTEGMSLETLTLDCTQNPMENFNTEKFRWIINLPCDYKTREDSIILKRVAKGRNIFYEITYHGPGNQFVEEFPEAVSEYHFIGFCYYEDNPEKKGNFNAKIISKE